MKQLWQTWIIIMPWVMGMGGYYTGHYGSTICMIGDSKHLKPTKTLSASYTSVPHAVFTEACGAPVTCVGPGVTMETGQSHGGGPASLAAA